MYILELNKINDNRGWEPNFSLLEHEVRESGGEARNGPCGVDDELILASPDINGCI